jgi:histone H3/H4
MGRNKTIIPKAPVARILIEAGAKRVADNALVIFSEIIEDMASEIGERALRIAKHSGRKTVQAGDIKIAIK